MLSFLNKYKLYVLGVLAILLSWGFAAHEISITRAADQKAAESTLAAAQAGFRVALANATVRDKQIVQLTRKADSAGLRADHAVQHAAVLQDSIPKLKARLDSVLTDSSSRQAAALLFAVMQARADSLDSAVVAKTTQNDNLVIALAEARASVATLSHAGATVDTAATKVVQAFHQSLFTKLAPKPGVGVAIGVDQNGHPAVVAGFTLSWPH